MDSDKKFTIPVAASDITPEMIQITRNVVDGWYNDGPVDWEDVWNRIDGAELEDGTILDLGTDLASSALRRLKREARQ